MPEDINRAPLLLVLHKVAHVSEEIISRNLKALSEFADFFPPVPAGETPLAVPADVPFALFVAAFMETLEYGMEGAQAVCKGRVNHSRGELEAVQKSVEVHLRRHFSNLSPYSAKVRELLLEAMNGGLKDVITVLTAQGGVLFRNHPYAAPPAGTGYPIFTPTFTRLRELAEKGAAASLGERKNFWRQPPDKTAGSVGGGKKETPGATGHRTAPA